MLAESASPETRHRSVNNRWGSPTETHNRPRHAGGGRHAIQETTISLAREERNDKLGWSADNISVLAFDPPEKRPRLRDPEGPTPPSAAKPNNFSSSPDEPPYNSPDHADTDLGAPAAANSAGAPTPIQHGARLWPKATCLVSLKQTTSYRFAPTPRAVEAVIQGVTAPAEAPEPTPLLLGGRPEDRNQSRQGASPAERKHRRPSPPVQTRKGTTGLPAATFKRPAELPENPRRPYKKLLK